MLYGGVSRFCISVDLKAIMVSMCSSFVLSITLENKIDIGNLLWLKISMAIDLNNKKSTVNKSLPYMKFNWLMSREILLVV